MNQKQGQPGLAPYLVETGEDISQETIQAPPG